MAPKEYNKYDEQFTTSAEAAREYLKSTDYIIIRAFELGEAIPEDVKAKRAKARVELSENTQKKEDLWALDHVDLFPAWASFVGKEVEKGQRLWWDGKLWKTTQYIQELLSNWTPVAAVSLFTEVSVAEIREITDSIPAENPFMKGEKGRWKGEVYVSQIDNNVWTPDAYPAGWVLA